MWRGDSPHITLNS